MTGTELRARVASLNVWRRGDQRAPHKPLLLLLALSRFAGGEEHLPYSEVEPRLAELLVSFGPPRKAHHPNYPFWRLQNDGLWVLDGAKGLPSRKSNTDPPVTALRERDPVGRFPDAVADLLHRDPALVADLSYELLNAHFPASVHEELLDAVGLDVASSPDARPSRHRRRRDPAFREAVLRAYGYACAVCGFSTRLGHTLVGLDAAHVKWHQAGGPDEVSNGLALCALHHRLLDRGAFTVALEGSVRVSEEAHGGEGFETWLLRFHEKPLRAPTSVEHRVAEPFAEWHHREVFRSPARTVSADAD